MDETVHIAFQMAEQVDAAEQGITRLCIAWLAMNSGVESEFGYKSQRELITAFTQVLDNYKDAYNAMLAAGGEEMEEAVRL